MCACACVCVDVVLDGCAYVRAMSSFYLLASYHAKETKGGGERERFPSKHTVLKVDLLYVRSENILISGVCVCVSTFSSAQTVFQAVGSESVMFLMLVGLHKNIGQRSACITRQVVGVSQTPSTGLRHPSFNHCRI